MYRMIDRPARSLRPPPRRSPAFDLATVAPRLAVAHRARRAELEELRLARIAARDDVHRLEWLVAHRELQAARAPYAKGSRRSVARYIAIREAKLATARRMLDRVRARATRLGA